MGLRSVRLMRAWLIVLAIGTTIGAAGCVQRTLSITSEPAGALVWLNDESVGRTPIDVPFTFYGVYDVQLEAEGYQPLWTEAHAKAPFWEYPGPDLIAEAIPGARSTIRWHFILEPHVEADPQAVIERALAMRDRVAPPADDAENNADDETDAPSEQAGDLIAPDEAERPGEDGP